MSVLAPRKKHRHYEEDEEEVEMVKETKSLARVPSVSVSAQSNKMTGAIVSAFTSIFTVQVLYSISAQRELWIAIFTVSGAVVVGLEKAISKCFYRRDEQQDAGRLAIIRFTTILRLTISFVIIKLVMDLIFFLMAINIMNWYHYVNIVMILLFFAVVILAHLEF